MASKIIYFISLMSLILVCGASVNKRPSWAIGRSVENRAESDEHLELVKKPSWAIGRDLSGQMESDETKDWNKRIIEFKRFIEFKKDLDTELYQNKEASVKKLLQKEKRPSIGARTRSLSKST